MYQISGDQVTQVVNALNDANKALEGMLVLNMALVTALREIAQMGNKAGSETAKHRLLQFGIPWDEDGYIPGKGFVQ